jgi:micrococcal nuclease
MKRITTFLLLSSIICLGATTKVKRVIDGDTFEIENGEKVRMIGINAPEIKDIFGKEAKQYLSSLIKDKNVYLQTDSISNDKDRYHRLLRYVFLDGADINRKMIADGFAFAYLKYRFSKSKDYEQAQIYAKENNNGIWEAGKKESAINLNRKDFKTLFVNHLPEVYFLGSLVIILLLVGLVSYFRK